MIKRLISDFQFEVVPCTEIQLLCHLHTSLNTVIHHSKLKFEKIKKYIFRNDRNRVEGTECAAKLKEKEI